MWDIIIFFPPHLLFFLIDFFPSFPSPVQSKEPYLKGHRHKIQWFDGYHGWKMRCIHPSQTFCGSHQSLDLSFQGEKSWRTPHGRFNSPSPCSFSNGGDVGVPAATWNPPEHCSHPCHSEFLWFALQKIPRALRRCLLPICAALLRRENGDKRENYSI